MLSFIFVIVQMYVVCLSGSESVQGFFCRLLIYVLSSQIQISRVDGYDPIDRLYPATLLCLFQAGTWISNVICHGLFFCSVSGGER